MDEKLASAIAHWGPRFTANGVLAADFDRITAPLEQWGEWCAAWSDGADEHALLADEAVSEGRRRSAAEHYWRAAVYYHFAKFVFVQDLVQLNAAHARAVECMTQALPYLDPPGERLSVPFEGAHLVGVLRRPPRAERPPIVVLIPGLDSTKEEFRTTEEPFLARGLATLSVDGPGQGESEHFGIRPDWEIPGAAVIDALERRSDIDASRIGVWGVSLGGYYAPRMASGESRVRACVSLSGPYDFGAAWARLPALTRETFVVRSGASDDHDAARRAAALTLADRSRSIDCPTLVVVGMRDRLFAPDVASRLAEEAPHAELIRLEDGNHGCANLPDHHRHRVADWLTRILTEN